jgi:hypothetical protein
MVGEPILADGVAGGEVGAGGRLAVEPQQPAVEQLADVADGGVGGSDERVQRQRPLTGDQALAIVGRGCADVRDRGDRENRAGDEDQDQDRADLGAARARPA